LKETVSGNGAAAGAGSAARAAARTSGRSTSSEGVAGRGIAGGQEENAGPAFSQARVG